MKLILAYLTMIGVTSPVLATEATYRCADRTTVRTVFSDPGPTGLVRLTFVANGSTVTLPQALSADGGRYADGSMEFWIKGKTARLTRNGAATDCKTR